jgi:hypothetical protein
MVSLDLKIGFRTTHFAPPKEKRKKEDEHPEYR